MFKIFNINALVADDFAEVRLVLCTYLQELGCKTYEAENGEQILEWLDKRKFNILFTDLEMPVMNGVDACEYIRNSLMISSDDMKIVAVTSDRDEKIEKWLKKIGVDQILYKPFDDEVVTELLHQYFHK